MALRLPNPPVERPLPNKEEAQEDQRQLGTWRNELYRMCELVGTATGTPGLIAAGAVGTLAITVTGCKADRAQAVMIGAPSGINSGLVWSGFISADNTVTVRIYNATGSGVTPASAQWAARVMP